MGAVHGNTSSSSRGKQQNSKSISSSSAESSLSSSQSSFTSSLSSSSTSTSTERRRFQEVYVEPAGIDRTSIFVYGFFVFVLALIWPPLILVVTYLLSIIVPYCFRLTDTSCRRRGLFKEFCCEAQNLPDTFRNIPAHIEYEESYWVNQRGMCLATAIMAPRRKEKKIKTDHDDEEEDDDPIKAVVFFCHGYSDHNSYMKRVEHQRMANQGIACVYIEYEGHGRSDGPIGLISNWDLLIDDVAQFFQEVAETEPRFANKPLFLVGESMGGAVVQNVYSRIGHLFNGAVFVSPMCKLSDDMLPPKWVIYLLKALVHPKAITRDIGYLPIAPSSQLDNFTYKLPEKRLLHVRCPLIYSRNPRLVTAKVLLDVTDQISKKLKDFEAPLLIVHGKEDRVTDPRLSQAFFDEAKSVDKTIKLYDGMWHLILHGEPDESIDLVFRDIISWILDRSG